MTKTASDRTTASSIAIEQEISEFSENSNLQLASLAALLEQFGSAQKDKLSKLKTSAESVQKEFSDLKKALSETQEARRQAEGDRDDTRPRLRAANPTTKRVRPSCSRRRRIIAALRTSCSGSGLNWRRQRVDWRRKKPHGWHSKLTTSSSATNDRG